MTIRDLLTWNSITTATLVVVMVLLLSGLIVYGVVHRRARVLCEDKGGRMNPPAIPETIFFPPAIDDQVKPSTLAGWPLTVASRSS